METITEHVICEKGRFWRETRTRHEIDPSAAFAKNYANREVVKMPNVFEVPNYGTVGMCYNPAEVAWYFTVPIQFINLRCEWRETGKTEDGDKILGPRFIYNKESTEVFQVKWWNTHDIQLRTPRIILLVQNKLDLHTIFTYQTWLMAFDGANVYQLPISNLYEHLLLCTGKYDSYSGSHAEAVKKSITQFESSNWNADLYQAELEKKTCDFFRLMPTKEGFNTLPINATKWTSLCIKRSVGFAQYVV